MMICIISGNYLEARRFADGQFLDENEWFFPIDEDDLKHRQNFHVIVIGSAGMNVPSSYFERILSTAKSRGRINRV